MRLLHIGFRVSNLERVVNAYTHMAGFKWDNIVEHQQPHGRFKVTHGYTTDGTEVEFVETLAGAAIDDLVLGDRDGVSHIAFAVDDLDAERAKAQAHGVEVLGEGDAPRARWLFLKDPSFGGVLIQLVELHQAEPAKKQLAV